MAVPIIGAGLVTDNSCEAFISPVFGVRECVYSVAVDRVGGGDPFHVSMQIRIILHSRMQNWV